MIIDQIKLKLEQYNYTIVDIIDNSIKHKGHKTNDSTFDVSHLKIILKSKGNSIPTEHRLVNSILKDFFLEVHSIEIEIV
jgi:stress-induced morphogen